MLTIDEIKKSVNVAELLDEKQLAKISEEVLRGYHIDKDSRSNWEDIMSEATDMAMMVIDNVDFPWEGASNIKYPLVAAASIDYASRTSPEILRGGNTFMAPKILGKDPDEAKYKAGKRACDYMSYDLNYCSPDWIEGTDKLLQILPVLGTVFKKTYYNEVEERICSELCTPNNIVVNSNIKSLRTAPRITHRLKFYKNDIVERQRLGIFREKDNRKRDLNICLDSYGVEQTDNKEWENISINDHNKQIYLLEQCCYLDLDEDGYKEPYIVTAHEGSGTVFRIVANFDEIKLNKAKKVQRIVPCYYYTDFHFIRSADGSYYSIGFGALLLSTNNGINTAFNMLFNAGTLCTTPGGVIGNGVRFKNGEIQFQLGRYQHVSVAPGEEIAKNIFPWPAKEPSQVLFQLLGLLIQTGKELASTIDMPTGGSNSMQNVAGSAVQQYIEQGSKTFIAINNRVHNSLSQEYMKIYYLNSKYLKQDTYSNIIDDPEADVKKDFNQSNMNIVPVADPSISTEAQRLYRATLVAQNPEVDRKVAARYYLQALQIDDTMLEKLLPEESTPTPEQQKAAVEMQEIQANIANISAQATLSAQEMQLKFKKLEIEMRKNEAMVGYYQALVWQIQQNALHDLRKDTITGTKSETQEAIRAADLTRKTKVDQHKAMMDEASLIHDMKIDTHTAKLDEINTMFDITNKKSDSKESKKKYNEEDIKHTAKIKGMTIKEVKELLGDN